MAKMIKKEESKNTNPDKEQSEKNPDSSKLGEIEPIKSANKYADILLGVLKVKSTPSRRKRLATAIFIITLIVLAIFYFDELEVKYYNFFPNIEIEILSNGLTVNRKIDFRAVSKKDLDDNWDWNYGDNTPVTEDKSHIYTASGTYLVEIEHVQHGRYKARKLIDIHAEAEIKPPTENLLTLSSDSTFYHDLKIPAGVTITIYRWYFEQIKITSDSNSRPGKYEIIEVSDMMDFPGYQWDKPGNYDVLLETRDTEGTQRRYEYQVEVIEEEKVSDVTPVPYEREPEPNSTPVHKILYTSMNQLSKDLTILANRGKSRQDKRAIVNRIEKDAASIKIRVNQSTLEDYLKKLQLEASSTQKTITVTKLKRNGENKIVTLQSTEN